MKHGMAGIGAFWCIVEMLYEEGGILPTEYDRIAFELRADNDLIKSVVNDFELFVVNGETFYSESVNSRLKIRTDKSDQARENVAKRWNKYKGNTPVLQKNEGGNTIKEKKRKEKDIILNGWEADQPLYLGLVKNYSKLFKMKLPLKYDEHNKLIAKFTPTKVKIVYEAMQNKSDLLKKYDSAYLTANNWLNRDVK